MLGGIQKNCATYLLKAVRMPSGAVRRMTIASDRKMPANLAAVR